jgi:hypothetical protein
MGKTENDFVTVGFGIGSARVENATKPIWKRGSGIQILISIHISLGLQLTPPVRRVTMRSDPADSLISYCSSE